MSVNSHLTSLAGSLVLTESELSSIRTSISTLRSRLKAYFGSALTRHFQFGSSLRGTILPRRADRLSDVDYMVVFDTSGEERKKPQTYLNRLKSFAEAKYSTSEIAQSHPTIVLSLNHIRFELVPAIDQYGLEIPSPASSWIEWTSTNPTQADQALVDKNKAEHYQIKPLVRLVKYWNARKSYPFLSYELERYIVSTYYYGAKSLADYFYSFWSGFTAPWDAPQYVKDAVSSARAHAEEAKRLENSQLPVSAESEIKKIVPAL